MTFEPEELNEIINKIIITSLFSALDENQKTQFYETAFSLIDRRTYCNSEGMSEQVKKLLPEALRVLLADRLSEL